MDDDVREHLRELLIAMKFTNESASHAEEMAWRTFGAMRRLDPRFPAAYEEDNGISYDELLRHRQELLEKLDALIAKLH